MLAESANGQLHFDAELIVIRKKDVNGNLGGISTILVKDVLGIELVYAKLFERGRLRILHQTGGSPITAKLRLLDPFSVSFEEKDNAAFGDFYAAVMSRITATNVVAPELEIDPYRSIKLGSAMVVTALAALFALAIMLSGLSKN